MRIGNRLSSHRSVVGDEFRAILLYRPVRAGRGFVQDGKPTNDLGRESQVHDPRNVKYST